MKKKFARSRHQQPRQDGSRGQGGFGGKPARRRSQSRAHAGPTTCPMCGAVVTNLRAHIHDRHDDAQSHPRA